jgi:hypothetical protein
MQRGEAGSSPIHETTEEIRRNCGEKQGTVDSRSWNLFSAWNSVGLRLAVIVRIIAFLTRHISRPATV